MRVLAATLAADLERGMHASFQSHLVGIGVALAVSVPVILALALATSLSVGASTAIAAVVQLFAGWMLAGRNERRTTRR